MTAYSGAILPVHVQRRITWSWDAGGGEGKAFSGMGRKSGSFGLWDFPAAAEEALH
jgi:hypothetical protein